MFRLLDSHGAVSRRSFAEPWGCEPYAEAVRFLLARLVADPDAEQEALETSIAIATAANLRGEVLLKLHGASTHLSSGCLHGEKASTTRLQPLVSAPSVSQALQQSLEACRSIEVALGPGGSALLEQCSMAARLQT